MTAPFSYFNKPSILPPETAQFIATKAAEHSRTPSVYNMVRALVRHLIDERTYPFMATHNECAAIELLVRSKIRYTRDPHGLELTYGSKRMVQLWSEFTSWSEDCDSYTEITMAMALSLGKSARATIASFVQERPDAYSHIFTEVFFPPFKNVYRGRWIIVDPSLGIETVAEMAKNIKHSRSFLP